MIHDTMRDANIMRFNALTSGNRNQFYLSPEAVSRMDGIAEDVDWSEYDRKTQQPMTRGLLRRPITGRLDAMKLMPSPFNNFAGANVRTMADAINAMPVNMSLAQAYGQLGVGLVAPNIVKFKAPTDRMAAESYGLPLDLARKYIAQTNEARKDPNSLFAPIQDNVGIAARVNPIHGNSEPLGFGNAFYKLDEGNGDGNYMYYAPYGVHTKMMNDEARSYNGYPRYNPRAASANHIDENKDLAFHEFGHSMTAPSRRVFNKKDPLHDRGGNVSPYRDSQDVYASSTYAGVPQEYTRIANHAKWMHARRMYDNGTPVQDINSAQAREGAAQVLRDWAADESRAYNEGGTEAARFHNYHKRAEKELTHRHMRRNVLKYDPMRGFGMARQPQPQIKLPIAATTHIPEGV